MQTIYEMDTQIRKICDLEPRLGQLDKQPLLPHNLQIETKNSSNFDIYLSLLQHFPTQYTVFMKHKTFFLSAVNGGSEFTPPEFIPSDIKIQIFQNAFTQATIVAQSFLPLCTKLQFNREKENIFIQLAYKELTLVKKGLLYNIRYGVYKQDFVDSLAEVMEYNEPTTTTKCIDFDDLSQTGIMNALSFYFSFHNAKITPMIQNSTDVVFHIENYKGGSNIHL